MGELFTPTHLIILLIFALPMTAVFIVPYWKIFEKAGFAGPLSLLMVFPVANLIVLYVVAFSPWKTVIQRHMAPSLTYQPPQPPTAG